MSKDIDKKANILARQLVKKFYENQWREGNEEWQAAKRCALICQKQMWKAYSKNYYGVPGQWGEFYLILKALPKAINNQKLYP